MGVQANGLLSNYLVKKRIEKARLYLVGKVLDYGCGTGDLAKYCSPDSYLGVDVDKDSVEFSSNKYPEFKFKHIKLNQCFSQKFDTIVSLAVIEHVKDPAFFLINFKKMLSKNGKIILTTPAPFTDLIHSLGSKIKLFSQEAENTHEHLINYKSMLRISENIGIKILKYKRFLYGANQLFVLK